MKKYLIIFVFCWVIFLVHAISIRHAIYGDGGALYSYTQALYFDRGLNFGPVYSFLANFHGVNFTFSRLFWNTSYNPHPIGTGIIWIPSMALISMLNFIFKLNAGRFDLIYEIGPGLTGILLVLAGLYFLEKYLQNFFSKKVALFSILLFFFASNLFYYSSFEPALSQQPAFFIVAFLLYFTYKMKLTYWNYFLVGALSGLLFITRIADPILLIPIIYQLVKPKPHFKYIVLYAISAIIFTIPLFWSYYIMRGNPFGLSYLEPNNLRGISYSASAVLNFLFTAKRGLFTWTPVYLLGFVGLIKSHKFLFLSALILFILVCSFWAGISVAFGQRYAMTGIPYFAFGAAVLLEKLNKKAIVLIFCLFLTWNLLTIFHFYFDKANMIKNDNFTVPEFIQGQFESPVQAFETHQRQRFSLFFL